MIKNNYLKNKMSKGQPVLGMWNTLGSPMAAEGLAHTGLDFLIIDFEHGPFQLDLVQDYVSRCELHNCTPIVRIPANADWMALQALDQGVHGIMIPHVDDYASAKKIVNYVKYFPQGKRGYTPFSKAGGFTNLGKENYAAQANDFTIISIIIESQEGLNNLDEILKIKEIDVVYFGAYDLSQALGVPGNVKHASVIKTMKEGVRKVVSAGKYAGGFVAQSEKDVKWLLDMGMNFITYDVDSSVLFKPINKLQQWFKEETK